MTTTQVFQTTIAGGRVILTTHHRQLVDHVTAAITSARRGQRAWVKSRALINGKPDRNDDSRFYMIEFRLRDEQLQITPFGGAFIVNPDDSSIPGWVADACRLARNLTNA